MLQRWAAPDGSAEVIWAAPDTPDGSPDQYALLVVRPHRAPVLLTLFGRNVDVAWSPDSRHIAVTDHIGSNVSDCFVLDVSRPAARLSLSSAFPALPVNLANAHFYVDCTGWRGSDEIAVTVSGHTDFYPSRNFYYRFVYNLHDTRMHGVESGDPSR